MGELEKRSEESEERAGLWAEERKSLLSKVLQLEEAVEEEKDRADNVARSPHSLPPPSSNSQKRAFNYP